MLDGKRTPATKRCNISWCAPHRFGCEAATRLELEARTILRGDHKNVEFGPIPEVECRCPHQ